MIRVVLFDFYGVFIPDAYSAWLEKNGLKREGIFATLISELDRDSISEKTFLDQLSKELGRTVASDEIHNRQPQPDPRLLELVAALGPHYSVALFSNASKKLRTKLDTLNMTTLFDDIIISGEIGHAKPSDEAFQIAITKLGVKADEILFIDDNPRNVEAAEKNGLHAALFTNSETTSQILKNHSLI